MEQEYRDMFGEVHASDRLRQEVLNMTKQEMRKVRRCISKTVLAAAIIAALLAGTALAASVPSIRMWFDRQWEETSGGREMAQEQKKAIDGLTQSVDVSTASNDDAAETVSGEDADDKDEETLAPAAEKIPGNAGENQAAQTPAAEETSENNPKVILDSVTVGEERLWMLLKIGGQYTAGKSYTFERTYLDGAPAKEIPDLGIQVGGSIQYSKDGSTVAGDGSLLMLIRYTSPSGSESLLNGGHLKLHLENLLADGELLCEGVWDLEFDLAAVESQPALAVENVSVPATDKEDREITVTFQQVQVHATGARLFTGPENAGFMLWPDTALVLTDGTEVRADGAHANWEGTTGDSRWITSYAWCVPVDLSQVKALRLGETVISLN